MKWKYMSLMLMTLPFVSCAQSKACLQKAYGFSRIVVSGVPPTDVVEVGGKVIGTTGGSGNTEYLLYLQTCAVSSVTITGLWINGAGYSARAVKSRTPVTIGNGSTGKGINETLIKKTTSAVWSLLLTPDDTMLKPATSVQKFITSNAVVITGIVKGQPFTTSLKSLKALQPFAAQ